MATAAHGEARDAPRASGGSYERPRGRARGAPLALAALLGAAVGVDAFRIGFFADDFHFLDVARRVPLIPLLTGQHGMWPWFRPLSRELYFKLVVFAGPASLPLAHALSFGCVFGCAWLLWRVGRRVAGAPAAAVAAALFVSYGFTKFLAAWASGFQDLLSLLLVLLAADALLRGHRGLALAWAFLAPFAKETGFVAFPLLIACDYLCCSRRFDRAWAGRLAAACGAAAVVHVLARWSWHTAGGTGRASVAPERLGTILGEAIGGFIGRHAVAGERALVLAIAAGASAALWLACTSPSRDRPARETQAGPPIRGTAFVAVAALLGLAPIIAGHLLLVTFAHAYHTFPAIPWVALLIGGALTRLPAPVWRTAVPVLVAWNVWGLGFRPPDLDRPEAWPFHRWDWPEAVRFSTAVRRLGDDVRAQLASRPESLVVLYEEMPPGKYFQTEDGPATREVLGDPSVRAYWINDPPADVAGDRLAILTFDARRLHLVREHWTTATAIFRAMNAIMARRGPAANAFALYEESPDSARFDRDYVRAAAALLEDGPGGFVRGLARAGLGDTLGESPRRLAEPLAAVEPGLGATLDRMLSRPLTAATHEALADSLLARGVVPRAGLELRIAATLDPDRLGDRYRLAVLMSGLGGTREALAELRGIMDRPAVGPWIRADRGWFEQLLRDSARSRP